MSSKLSREEYRKAKILDEQRKAGTVPAEIDAETGRDINPHIPEFISKAPWYVDSGVPTLKHQRMAAPSKAKSEATKSWYQRGLSTVQASKYRRGACENCGAMTHTKKDCFDRPRKKGAKFTNKDIMPDEMVDSVELGFEAKRDRWNGYDGEDHLQLINEQELLEEARKLKKARDLQQKLSSGEATVLDEDSETSDDEADEDKYAEESSMPGQRVNTALRQTVRNLRIREDTAKYLLNLDVNSAYYDPKTRSMRENPLKDSATGSSSTFGFQGDNFVRQTGDVNNLAKVQLFAWEAESRGKDVHLHALPTQAELLYKDFSDKRSQVASMVKEAVLERYGDESAKGSVSAPLELGQTEKFVEYDVMGNVKAAKSSGKVEEDAKN